MGYISAMKIQEIEYNILPLLRINDLKQRILAIFQRISVKYTKYDNVTLSGRIHYFSVFVHIGTNMSSPACSQPIQ